MAIVMIHQTKQTIDSGIAKLQDKQAGHVHFYRPESPDSSSLQGATAQVLPFDEDGGTYKRNKGKGRADDVEEEIITEPDVDTDEEEDGNTPVPQFISGAADGDEDDLSWASIPVPKALTEHLPQDLPEVLLEIVRSSVDVLQSRVAEVIAHQAACAERAEAEAEARERASLELPHSPKGKEKETQHVEAPEPPATTAAARRSRRRFFASRLLRHVHMYSSSSSSSGSGHRGDEEGESSSASASAMPVEEEGERGAPTGKPWAKSIGNSSRQRKAAHSTKETIPAPMAPILPAGPEMMWVVCFVVYPVAQLAAYLVAYLVMRWHLLLTAPSRECVSCFDEIPAREAVKTTCHNYCLECFRQLVTTALDNEAQFPPKCCLNEIPQQTITKYVPRALRKRYTAKAEEFRVSVDQRLYCSHPDCGLFVPPAQTSKAARIGRCRSGHETCTMCRQAAHGSGNERQSCPEDRDQRLADDLAADEGWKRCTRCGVLVEHSTACQHMTCRCGAEFCYVCGAPWRTCQCDMNDLERLKAGAAARRAARQAREQEDAAAAAEAAAEAIARAEQEVSELREALRLIEEFERVEAANLDRRRTENRQRLQAMRAQRESTLRATVVDKYVALQRQLAALVAAQSAAARRQRRTERANRAAADAAALADLAAEQTQQREALAARAQQRVRNAELAWKRDWRARVVLEQQLERAYEKKLRELQNTSADGDNAFVDRGLRAYMRHNDARLDVYLQWRAHELAAVRRTAEDERRMRAELLKQTRRQAVETQRTAAAQQRQRHAAERMWVRAVAAQRQQQLAEMETLEQSLGLEGSTADADVELLLLLELERSGEVDAADLELEGYCRNMLGQGTLEP